MDYHEVQEWFRGPATIMACASGGLLMYMGASWAFEKFQSAKVDREFLAIVSSPTVDLGDSEMASGDLPPGLELLYGLNVGDSASGGGFYAIEKPADEDKCVPDSVGDLVFVTPTTTSGPVPTKTTSPCDDEQFVVSTGLSAPKTLLHTPGHIITSPAVLPTTITKVSYERLLAIASSAQSSLGKPSHSSGSTKNTRSSTATDTGSVSSGSEVTSTALVAILVVLCCSVGFACMVFIHFSFQVSMLHMDMKGLKFRLELYEKEHHKQAGSSVSSTMHNDLKQKMLALENAFNMLQGRLERAANANALAFKDTMDNARMECERKIEELRGEIDLLTSDSRKGISSNKSDITSLEKQSAELSSDISCISARTREHSYAVNKELADIKKELSSIAPLHIALENIKTQFSTLAADIHARRVSFVTKLKQQRLGNIKHHADFRDCTKDFSADDVEEHELALWRATDAWINDLTREIKQASRVPVTSAMASSPVGHPPASPSVAHGYPYSGYGYGPSFGVVHPASPAPGHNYGPGRGPPTSSPSGPGFGMAGSRFAH